MATAIPSKVAALMAQCSQSHSSDSASPCPDGHRERPHASCAQQRLYRTHDAGHGGRHPSSPLSRNLTFSSMHVYTLYRRCACGSSGRSQWPARSIWEVQTHYHHHCIVPVSPPPSPPLSTRTTSAPKHNGRGLMPDSEALDDTRLACMLPPAKRCQAGGRFWPR
jgi:hypothetical protein